MPTIAENLTSVAAAKASIKAAIEGKGIALSGVPFSQYGDKINQVGGYVRPADWLALPAISGSDQKFVGLHAVFTDSNFVALSASGAYTVDWGDGTVENFAAGAVAQHEYNYATFDVAGATLCSRGYKQAIVVVTPQSGQTLTALNLNQRHTSISSVTSSGFLDIAIAGKSISDLRIGVQAPGSTTHVVRHALLEKVVVASSQPVNCYGLFYNSRSLKSLSFPSSIGSGSTSFSNMFAACYSLTSIPSIDTSSGLDFSNMFTNCTSLPVGPTLNTASGTNFSGMFSSCSSLQYVPAYNTANGTNFSNMFSVCSSLVSAPAFSLSAATVLSGMFNTCTRLSRMAATGIAQSIDLSNALLSAARINDVFTNLATVSGKNINISSNYGAATCNRSIATSKGWTVTG